MHPTRKTILDFGCGRGKNSNYLSKRGAVHGIDVDPENIKAAQRDYPHIFFRTADGDKLPYPDGMFDEIHAYDVLEHVDNLDVAMLELCRVLRTGGLLVVEVPFHKSENMLIRLNPNYFMEVHHVRVFRGGELKNLLERYRLRIMTTSRRKFIDNVYFSVFFLFGGHIQGQCGNFGGRFSRAWQNVCLLFSEDLFRKHRYWLYAPVWIVTLPIGILLSQFFPKTVRTVSIKQW